MRPATVRQCLLWCQGSNKEHRLPLKSLEQVLYIEHLKTVILFVLGVGHFLCVFRGNQQQMVTSFTFTRCRVMCHVLPYFSVEPCATSIGKTPCHDPRLTPDIRWFRDAEVSFLEGSDSPKFEHHPCGIRIVAV